MGEGGGCPSPSVQKVPSPPLEPKTGDLQKKSGGIKKKSQLLHFFGNSLPPPSGEKSAPMDGSKQLLEKETQKWTTAMYVSKKSYVPKVNNLNRIDKERERSLFLRQTRTPKNNRKLVQRHHAHDSPELSL